MRTLFLFSALFSISLYAQTTFAPVGAKWTYEQGFWGYTDSNLAVIEVTMDTVINGVTCSWLEPDTGTFLCYQLYHAVFARHDSVFLWDEQDQLFRLLYRFDANVNDSWRTPVNWLQSGLPCARDTMNWTVQDTGHILVDGVQLRRLEVTVNSTSGCMLSGSSGVIIEKLGDLSYLFDWIHYTCFGESFERLRCYEDPDISWLDAELPNCEFTTSICDCAAPYAIHAFPTILEPGQPMNVTVNDNGLYGSTLEVIDALGRIQQRIALTGWQQIPLTTSGAYFLRVAQPDGSIWRERVVVR